MTDHFPTFRRWFGSPLAEGTPNWSWRSLLAPAWKLAPLKPSETRESQQRTLLRILAAGVAHGMPLPPLVAAIAQEHRRGYRLTLSTLAHRLAAGTSLSSALEQTPGALSDDATLAVRVGAESGVLASSLKQLVDRDDSDRRRVMRRYRAAFGYFAAMATVVALVAGFLLIKTVPCYLAIYDDFDIELTPSLRSLIDVGRVVSVVMPAVAVIGAVTFIVAMVVTRGSLANRLAQLVWGRVFPPIAGLRSAELWNYFAEGAAAGRPLVGTISTLAKYHYDPSVRRRLLIVRNELDHGADALKSLVAVGLATPAEVQAVENSLPGAVPWTMRQFAMTRRQRAYETLDRWADFLFPLGVIVFGCIVLFIAVACLSPIEALTRSLGG